MDKEIFGLMIPVIAIIGGITMIIYIRKYEFLEKEKMIEKGMDPGNLKRIERSSGWGAVRFAFTAIGVGIGIVLASLLESSGMNDGIAFPAMILTMGGIGLFLGTHYAKKQEKSEEKD